MMRTMMNRPIRCSECGALLQVNYKATAQLSEKVIGLVSPHVCSEFKSLADLGITPDPVPIPVSGKFLQKLDELNPRYDPGDRRPGEQVKTSEVPKGLMDIVRQKGLK